jgi:hypothetical protein
METSSWILRIVVIVVIIILLISAVAGINASGSKSTASSRLIDPSKLPVPRGAYGVVQSVNSVQPIIGCEPSGTAISNKLQPCTFSEVPSLNAAMQLCDVHIKVCDGFVYSPNTKTVNFIDTRQQLKSNTTSNTGWDAYIRQYPRSYT